MITDIEMGIASAFGSRLRSTAASAQAIVDRKNLQLGRANSRIASLEVEVAALRRERTQRGLAILGAAVVRNTH